MLQLNKSYPTLETRPRTLRPHFWGAHQPYYSKRNEPTRQNHILMDKLAHISNGRQSESWFEEGVSFWSKTLYISRFGWIEQDWRRLRPPNRRTNVMHDE